MQNAKCKSTRGVHKIHLMTILTQNFLLTPPYLIKMSYINNIVRIDHGGVRGAVVYDINATLERLLYFCYNEGMFKQEATERNATALTRLRTDEHCGIHDVMYFCPKLPGHGGTEHLLSLSAEEFFNEHGLRTRDISPVTVVIEDIHDVEDMNYAHALWELYDDGENLDADTLSLTLSDLTGLEDFGFRSN